MILRKLAPIAAVACGLALLIVQSQAQNSVDQLQISAAPKVETIDFKGLNEAERGLVLQRIALRAGDVLTSEERHRIADELRSAGKQIGKTLTFSDKPGARFGTVKLRISDGC